VTSPNRHGPIRRGLLAKSALQPLVKDGVQALKREHRSMIAEEIRESFVDSLDIDHAFEHGHEQENRWDYLLGYDPAQAIIGIEPHSAKNDQISTVIAKRKYALLQLRDHLKPGAHVVEWYWVASGRVDFAPFERASLRLQQEGITFIGKALLKRHLPVAKPGKPK
jgi:hypothetical protein